MIWFISLGYARAPDSGFPPHGEACGASTECFNTANRTGHKQKT